jgi:hypothetical protein
LLFAEAEDGESRHVEFVERTDYTSAYRG